MPLVNTHSHTALCGHGEGTVAELVAAADAAGIEVLAVTEHFPLSGAFDPRGDEAMPRESVAGYLADIDRARADHPHMTILSGCEMDWLGTAEDRAPAERDTSRFDVVLGSVRFLGTWGIDNGHRGPWPNRARLTASGANTWTNGAQWRPRPTVSMSFPTLMREKKLRSFPDLSAWSPCMRAWLEAARAGGRMVEVNTAGAVKRCAEMYPTLKLLSAFRRAGYALRWAPTRTSRLTSPSVSARRTSSWPAQVMIA